MTTPTKLWLCLCTIILWSGGWWYGGYHTADAAWTQRDTKRKLTDAEEAGRLSEEYRVKENKLNEHIGYLETKGINDSAAAEMAYRDVIDRLHNADRHPTDGLRVKSTLTCRTVSNNPATPGSGNEEVQTGLSPEVAGFAIGVGADCDQAIISLQACQDYAESLRKYKEKPLN